MMESMSSSGAVGGPPGEFNDGPGVASAVIGDLGRSPTPYHAVARSRELLVEAGFAEVAIDEPFPAEPGRYLVAQGGTLLAWLQGGGAEGFTVVGAHTDSPNLRVRTRPDLTSAGVHQIGMEIYGGVLLNSWLDRGLGLAGRVAIRRPEGGTELRLVLDDRPLMVIPQLAIHLDRDVTQQGLKLNPQQHLIPLWALEDNAARTGAPGDDAARTGTPGDDAARTGAPGDSTARTGAPEDDAARLRGHVAGLLDVAPDRILSWDLMAFDTQAPEVIGRDSDLFSSGRIDNLLSSFCGVRALAEIANDEAHRRTPVLVLYDHEEVGSESATGASGALLGSVLERIATAQGHDRAGYLAALQRSIVISADGAHATHPNYVDRHEPSHHIALNAGVVVKRNANQRYATDAISEAFVVEACERAGVPVQFYIHRNDLPCGSTIGPTTAARLGVATVDIGAPQLAMHSARETAGLADVDHLHRALVAAWRTG